MRQNLLHAVFKRRHLPLFVLCPSQSSLKVENGYPGQHSAAGLIDAFELLTKNLAEPLESKIYILKSKIYIPKIHSKTEKTRLLKYLPLRSKKSREILERALPNHTLPGFLNLNDKKRKNLKRR